MTHKQKTFSLPTMRPGLIEFLETRRSNLAKLMTDEGPSEAQIKTLLTIAARVPDHRKLTPWRFVCFQGNARAEFGQRIASVFMKDNPEMPLDRSVFESQRLLRAPLVVAVISSPVECMRGTPLWEQQLSAGAVCFNLCLAAQAHGFGAQWLTEWCVAGYVYIGKVDTPSTERARPNISEKLTYWGN